MQYPVFELKWATLSYGRLIYLYLASDDVGCFLAGSNNGLALRKLFQEQTDVGRLYNLQKFVGSIVLKASDGSSGILEGNSLLLEELNEIVLVECFFAG